MPRVLAALTMIAAVVFAASLAAEAPRGTSSAGAGRAGAALDVATFAAGCYWCVESDFDKVKGVTETISGFMGGTVKNPTYRQVSAGGTGHLEVVQLKYDPGQVGYQQLLDHYWKNVDPLDGGGQFCDRGDSYRPAIFVHNDDQRRLAEASKTKVAKRFEKPVKVVIRPASDFTAAEAYHQNYYRKNQLKYKYYRYGCGRDQRLRELWGAKTG